MCKFYPIIVFRDTEKKKIAEKVVLLKKIVLIFSLKSLKYVLFARIVCLKKKKHSPGLSLMGKNLSKKYRIIKHLQNNITFCIFEFFLFTFQTSKKKYLYF